MQINGLAKCVINGDQTMRDRDEERQMWVVCPVCVLAASFATEDSAN